MKKKILVTAIASALIAPAAFAAEGSDGMSYTSASEGFYGTLRARFDTGNKDGDDPVLNNGDPSRVGVRGTLDMGNGLTGFYQWEAAVSGGQKSATGLRQNHVGIRGAFGEVKVGSFTDPMIGVSGHTDVTNSVSGNFDLSASYRVDGAIAYTTPDLNGFQANGRIIAGDAGSGNTVDDWAINASYSIQGLTAVAGYRVETDGLDARVAATNYVTDLGDDNKIGGGGGDADTTTAVTAAQAVAQDDASSWGAGLGYGQDNWNIGFWYGEQENQGGAEHAKPNTNDDDTKGSVSFADEDTEIFSIAGDVAVGKTKLYAFTETAKNAGGKKGVDDTISGVGVQYSFTANSKVWIDYQANDLDSKTGDKEEDDKVVIGLRHDF